MPQIRWSTLNSAITKSDAQNYHGLLDRAFGLSPEQSYLEDFPVWDPEIVPGPDRFQLCGWAGNRLVTTASIRFVELRPPDSGSERALKLGMIGAVATHPEFAKKGLASEALDLVLREGVKRGTELYVLWGAASPIYSKRGFTFGGKQIRVPLPELAIAETSLRGFELRSGWDVAIAEMLLRRRSGVLYRDADILWLSRHANVEWRTLWLDRKCLAYCAWNRGIDLPGIIHELDGTDEGMRELLRAIRARYPELVLLAHPDRLPPSDHPVEILAQFRFEPLLRKELGTDPGSSELVAKLWFSGMDSC